MWRSLIDKFKGKGRKRGYTLIEMLVVIGIIAIVSSIVVVGIVSISRNLKFKQRNDYAKTVFMAAQANLSEMRSDGSLYLLQSNSDSVPVPQGHCGFPAEHWSYEYEYTSSEFPEPAQYVHSSFDLVLPANSVESTVRNRNVIIEYNPKTGNVFAVFYCDDEILSQYRDEGTLPRDEESRREMMLGYYDGSGLSSSELDLESTDAYLVFDNEGQEGILTVKVPVPESYYAYLNEFMDGLIVKLTIVGELSGGMIGPFDVDMSTGSVDVDGRTVMQDFVLDSLTDFGSFANMAAAPSADAEGNLVCSFRHIHALLCLDRSAKENQILWTLSGAADEFGLTEIQKSSAQHTAFVDGSYITIFDNGNRNSTSRVVGYCIDPETKTLKAFRSYTLGGKYSEACGSAQHLYDEVYVIGWGMTFGNPEAMSVVDFATGETLMSVYLKNPENNTYRCLYFD